MIPKFVINELQGIADSSDRMRRSRGRRGLDILNRLRNSETIDVQIFERDLPEFAGQPVDLKLVALARHLSGKLITNDYNLNKVAQLQDVMVINLNDLANAMKPSFLPGEQISVRVVKAGEEHGQGIGYLDDGTMVVIENGREHIGQQVMIAVTSVIQKSAGRMVFGRFDSASRSAKEKRPAECLPRVSRSPQRILSALALVIIVRSGVRRLAGRLAGPAWVPSPDHPERRAVGTRRHLAVFRTRRR